MHAVFLTECMMNKSKYVVKFYEINLYCFVFGFYIWSVFIFLSEFRQCSVGAFLVLRCFSVF